MTRFCEPFLGSGAVFFAVLPRRALLSDLNGELIGCFQEVRDDPEAVMAELDTMVNSQEEYLRIRALDPEGLAPVQRAARVIYLNKTGFRGIWRVNKWGRFNVPYGQYDRALYNRETVLAASIALRCAELRHVDFTEALLECRRGDWVYLDPPYVPLGGYSDFKRYTPGQFHAPDHSRLVEACRDLDRRDIKWLLTNTNKPEVRALYAEWPQRVISTRRDVNLNSASRDSSDLVVSNYLPSEQGTLLVEVAS